VETNPVQNKRTHADKTVIFYHTYGYKKDKIWVVPMRVWVHENPNIIRRSAAKLVSEVLEEKIGMTELGKYEKELFMARAKEFIADSKSNERVVIRFENDPERKKYHVAGKNGNSETDGNGRIEGVIKLKSKTVQDLLLSQDSQQGLLRFQAVSRDHRGIGWITIVPPTGLSVISDIKASTVVEKTICIVLRISRCTFR
jgi:hypothetical protein